MAGHTIHVEIKVRPCKVDGNKALFHCWGHRATVVGDSPLRGGHCAGQISTIFGAIEKEDGTVHEVMPTSIQFVDHLMDEFAWPSSD